uniref:C2H2-type domain-containing protein n=1 Tax=Opuntia streptacantha TaxID=393608 RepID=A0A7C9EYM8_OPUST
MEDERDRAEFKHVCKLCNKRYPSGKSLGGHMRSHVIASARKAKAQALLLKNKAPTFDADFDHDDHDEEEEEEEINDKNGGGHSVYGLRENPKKTWRAEDHSNFNTTKFSNQNQNNQNQQDKVCKQCGKAFQSLKALCGHMSSHSERERNFKDDDEDDVSWSSESHSDHNMINTHNSNLGSLSSKRQTRSSYSRYRSLAVVDSLSNNSEIDQHEQEEVAICLMMLSRDYSSSPYRSTNCFNFAAESSDNNSVILEGGSSSNHATGGIGKSKDLYLKNNDKFKKVGFGQKLNEAQEMDNSDSGYFENGAKELESDDSVGAYFVKNNYYYSSYSSKNPKPEFGSGLVDSSDGSKKRVRDVGGFRFDSPESEGNSSKKVKQDCHESSNNNHSNPKKGSKFECILCNQTFKTHQALGGHVITHRKNGESSLDTNHSPKITTSSKAMATTNYAKKGGGSKKLKGHKCPYCPKVFKSGQALGGHKRSHMMGGGGGTGGLREERPVTRAPPLEPEPEPEQKMDSPPLIDLNLPAPVEEEASGNSHYVTW